jgi:hypothetical protein
MLFSCEFADSMQSSQLLLMLGCDRSVGPLCTSTANTRIGGCPFRLGRFLRWSLR